MNVPKHNTLAISAPGDSCPIEAARLYLVDGREYPRAQFAAQYAAVEAGPGVETIGPAEDPSFKLSPDALRRIDAARVAMPHVLFYVGSDTHVKTLVPIAKLCPEHTFVVRASKDEAATTALDREGIPWEYHRARSEAFARGKVAVCANDWGLEDRLFIARCRRHRIPTCCIQESLINFGDTSRRMEWADTVCLQGPQTCAYLKRDIAFLTGNPRYDTITPLPPPQSFNALINVNFTYGVFEDAAESWTRDVVAVVENARIPYAISRHPRDCTNLDGIHNILASDAYRVQDQLRDHAVVITRFSSLAHEALLKGRIPIYYNPHGEAFPYFQDNPHGLLPVAHTPSELHARLEELRRRPSAPIDANADYRNQLFCAQDGQNHLRCVNALALLAAMPYAIPRDAPALSTRQLALHLRWRTRLLPRLKGIPGVQAAWKSLRHR